MTGLILYFSGTGNTKRVANEFKACLLKKKVNVLMYSIEEHIDLTNIGYDFLIVGFPKYYEYPVLCMLNYLKRNLQKRDKPIPTLAFCTQAGPLQTDFTGLEKLLKKKNHRLTVAISFPYANNMMIFRAFKPTEPAKLMENQENIRKQIEPLLNIFLKGEISKEHTKIWQRFFIYLVAAACTKLMPAFAMRFSADQSCTHCGLCAENCPMKNIKMVHGNPVFENHCLFCMRCINSCPSNSIRYNKRKCRQYKWKQTLQPIENKPSDVSEHKGK